MEDLSLHILDIAENGIAAGAGLVEILVTQDDSKDLLQVVVRDNGMGMDEGMRERVRDPFVTTRTTRRVGLGIPLFEQAAREAGGDLNITSGPGKGTCVTATFQAGHVDRKPLGDLTSTMISLIAGNPEVDFRFHSDLNGKETLLDTKEIREQLKGIAEINDPAVLKLIRGILSNP